VTPTMLQALLRTMTEILDSKKAAYSFIATILAIVLHLQFGVSPQNALLLVSPLGIATAAQAHVDAKQREASTTSSTATATPPSGGGSGENGGVPIDSSSAPQAPT
jgi:hypothetical protein